MEYQELDIDDFIPEFHKRKKARDKEMAEEFSAIMNQLKEQGFEVYYTAPIYKKLSKKYGVSVWTVRRAVNNSK